MVAIELVVALPVVLGALLGRLGNHTLVGAVVGAARRSRDVIPIAGDDRQLIDRLSRHLHGVLVLSTEHIASELRLDVKVVRSPSTTASSQPSGTVATPSRCRQRSSLIGWNAAASRPRTGSGVRSRRASASTDRGLCGSVAFMAALAIRRRERWVDLGAGNAVLERRPWGP